MANLKISKIIIIFFSFSLLFFLHPFKAAASTQTYILSGSGTQTRYLPGPVKVGKVNVQACADQNRNGGFQLGIRLLYNNIQVAYKDTLNYARTGCPMWSYAGSVDGTALDFGGTSADAVEIIPVLGNGSYSQMSVSYEAGAGPPPSIIQCGVNNAIEEYVSWWVPWGSSGDFVLPQPLKIHLVNAYGLCDQNEGGCSDAIALFSGGTQVALKPSLGTPWPYGVGVGVALGYAKSGFPAWSYALSPKAGALNFGGVLADTIRAVSIPRIGALLTTIFYTHEPAECSLSHTACQGNSCVTVSGAGADQCNGDASCAVPIPIPTADYVIDPPFASQQDGQTQQFIGWYDPDGPSGAQAQQDVTNSATWNSSNTSIATINSSGLATCSAVGSVTINSIYSGITAMASLSCSASAIGSDTTISGYTKEGSGAVISGATVTAADGCYSGPKPPPITSITNASGYYSITVPSGWSRCTGEPLYDYAKVSASKTSCTFSPASANINLTTGGNVNQDFTGTCGGASTGKRWLCNTAMGSCYSVEAETGGYESEDACRSDCYVIPDTANVELHVKQRSASWPCIWRPWLGGYWDMCNWAGWENADSGLAPWQVDFMVSGDDNFDGAWTYKFWCDRDEGNPTQPVDWPGFYPWSYETTPARMNISLPAGVCDSKYQNSGNYEAQVSLLAATYGHQDSAVATVPITVAPPASLSVTLSATPDSGSAPLYTNLRADVSGTAAGTINYNFWFNCNGNTTNLATAEAACGVLPAPVPSSCVSNSNGIKCNGISALSQNASHTYSAGNWRPKVIVERGAASPAEDRIDVTVTAGATAPNTPTNFKAVPGANCNQLNLSWIDVSNETRYEIDQSNDSRATWFSLSANWPADSISYPVSGLSGSTSYDFRIKACNSIGCSGYVTASGTTSACPTGNVTIEIKGPTGPFTPGPITINRNEGIEIKWNGTNVNSCQASAVPANAQWTGPKNDSGGPDSINNIVNTTTFSLNCLDDATISSVGGSAVVNVSFKPWWREIIPW